MLGFIAGGAQKYIEFTENRKSNSIVQLKAEIW